MCSRLFFTYEEYATEMDILWGFLGSGVSSDPASVAPVIIGEFGLGANHDMANEQEVAWYGFILRYLRERSFAGIAYWPLTQSSMAILKQYNSSGGLQVANPNLVLKPLQEYMRDTSWGK